MTKSVRNVSTIKRVKRGKVTVVILSSGMGVRMKSLGVRSLIKIRDNTTLLDWQLEIINNIFPNSELILVTGFESDRLMNAAPNNIIKVENERYESTNVCRSLGIALRASTSERVVVISGDIMFNQETLKGLNTEESCLIVEKNEESSKERIGLTANNDLVEHLFYDLPNRWTGISYLCKKELKLAQSISWNRQKEKLFGFEVINEIIDRGGCFKLCSPKGMRFIDIDSAKDIIAARNITL